MRKQTPKQQAKALDDLIAAAYHRHCAGTQISMLDISKLYADARVGVSNGQNLDTIMPPLIARYNALKAAQVTTLSVVLRVFGWQGGTIHQALDAFRNTADPQKQDAVCNALMRAIDSKTLQDVATAKDFFNARIG